MTHRTLQFSILCALIALMSSLRCFALDSNLFASNSRLASGNWVKIAVKNDGIHQITREQLRQMGFDNFENVQIYGSGGHAISEKLDGTSVDDVQPIPILRTEDKIIFYAQGTIGMNIRTYEGYSPFFARTFNAYSTKGYYFISTTDNPLTVESAEVDHTGTNPVHTSYAPYLHERELVSVGHSGKQLLGEDLLQGAVQIPYTLPRLYGDTLTISVNATARSLRNSFINARVQHNSTSWNTVSFYEDDMKIWPVGNSDIRAYHRYAEPVGNVAIDPSTESGQIEIYITGSGTFTRKRLDKFLITYRQVNDFARITDGQLRMDYVALADTDVVAVANAPASTMLWEVSDPRNPQAYSLRPFAIGDSVGQYFTPGGHAEASTFVAFDPAAELPTCDSYETIANQNLHALPTPDMLIVTNKTFDEQAQRLAQFHRDYDGLDVAVIDQEDIFNEFSSGTPDAMAVRLLCKMLYDRNKNKFKYLLMMGPATYDYRSITTNKANKLITFVTDNSETEEYSYSTDDFFGMLDDYSGVYLTNDVLRLGVGRLTCTTPEEARKDVDKIIRYVSDPDYGPWRNNITLWADTRDSYLHEMQAEGIGNIIHDELGLSMVTDKAFVDLFPKAVNETSIAEEKRTAAEAKRHIKQMLTAGQYFGTFVGHANESNLTYSSHMWTSADVLSYEYRHQPIFTTACCDVARFDSDSQGLAELMLHQENGGAIALLAPARQVESTSNDKLNQAFTKALFNYKTTGAMTTLGQAYMAAKQSSTVRLDANKMSFLLLGDPAIKVNYPKPLLKITHVDDQNLETGAKQVGPLQQISVTAKVLDENGNLDTSFSGNATVTLYDVERFFVTASTKVSGREITRDIYHPRDILTRVNTNAEQGVINTTLLVPRNIKAKVGEKLALTVYAHKQGTDHMVSGTTTQITADQYDPETAVTDTEAPTIDQMFLNNEEDFEKGALVSPSATLYISATDNIAFNTQSMPIGQPVKLTLDGASNLSAVSNYLTTTDGGRSLSIAFPLSGLAHGRHTLALQVQDAAGNYAQRSIDFIVGTAVENLTLNVDNYVASSQAEFTLEETGVEQPLTLRVTDAAGNVVHTASNVTLPYSWNLNGSDNQRVPAGLYRAYANYINGSKRGSTGIAQFVVISPVNTVQ